MGVALLVALAVPAVRTVVAARRERAAGLREWQGRLSAMADDRAASMDRWLADALADANLAASYPTAVYLLSGRRGGPLPFPVEEGPRGHLQVLLGRLVREKGHTVAQVVDAGGRIVTASEGAGGPSPAALELAREVLKQGSPRVEMVRHPSGLPALVAASPIRAREGLDVVGAVVLEDDPWAWLYPQLAQEPLPTRTGETVLLRREGRHVRFLSPLRHDPAPPLSLLREVTQPGLAGAVAAAGRSAFGEYVDYRGAAILAATRRLRRASWGLVVKVDRDEALAEADAHVLQTGATWLSVSLGVLGLAYGLWRRQRAAFALEMARRESRLGIALDHANDVILFARLDGRILEARGAVQKLYGRTPAETVGLSVLDLRARADPEAFRADMERARETDGVVLDTVHRRRDGTEVPVEVSARFVRMDGEEVLLAIVRDATERKAREEQLRNLSRAVEQSPASVIITDPSGAIEYVNPRFVEVTGYTLEEVRGRNSRLLKSGRTPPEVYRAMWAAITAGQEWRGQLQNRKKSGEAHWEDVSISPILDERGCVTHFVAIKEDVTARRLAEVQLRETQQQLLQSQKIEAVGRLAGGVAHDFNNILGVIIGFGEMLARSLREGSQERTRVDQILKAAERAAGLTRQLLAFSRRQILKPKVVDLNAVVADAEKMLRRVISEDVELILRLSPDLWAVKVDPGQMEQVILNLVLNARDAMPRGGLLTLETSNADLDPLYSEDHEPMPSGVYAMLAVSDTGVGMDDDTRLRIFEPFFTTKPPGQGTGLGLATVYGIVKQSGGFIWVYSEPGRGSSFKIFLPRADGVAEASGAPRPVAEPPRGRESVLVVEDQEHLAEVVREVLEGLGYDVLVAADGPEALELAARRDSLDLLLTDVVLPGLSGPEVAEKLAADRPGLRVLYMSGYTAEVMARHGVLQSGTVLMEKPFTTLTLARRVREALDVPGPPP